MLLRACKSYLGFYLTFTYHVHAHDISYSLLDTTRYLNIFYRLLNSHEIASMNVSASTMNMRPFSLLCMIVHYV